MYVISTRLQHNAVCNFNRKGTPSLAHKVVIQIIACFQNSTIIGDTYCLVSDPLPPSIKKGLDSSLKKRTYTENITITYKN